MESINVIDKNEKNVLKKQNPDLHKGMLRVQCSSQWIQVPFKNIIRLEGECNYTIVYTAHNKYVAAKTLKDFEKLLDGSTFVRVHKSHIINMCYLQKLEIEKKSREISIEGGRQVEVSRRRLRKVIDKIVFFRNS